MINNNDSLKFSRVISKKIYIEYNDLKDEMEQFLLDINSCRAIPTGNFFYSLNNIPIDGKMDVELFCPIKESDFQVSSNLQFHSYYSIDNMISYCLYANIEKNVEVAYGLLLKYMNIYGLKQVTPFFHYFSGSKDRQHVYIKVGVAVKE